VDYSYFDFIAILLWVVSGFGLLSCISVIILTIKLLKFTFEIYSSLSIANVIMTSSKLRFSRKVVSDYKPLRYEKQDNCWKKCSEKKLDRLELWKHRNRLLLPKIFNLVLRFAWPSHASLELRCYVQQPQRRRLCSMR